MTTPLRRLGDLATIQTGIPFVASAQGGGGEYVLMPSALRADEELMPHESMVQRVELLAKPEDRYRVRPQDILLTAKATPATLRCGYLSREWGPRWLFAANLIRVHPYSGTLHPRFLHAWLSHPQGRAALLSVSQSTTGQLNLTASSLAEVQVPVPPWEQQIKAVEFLYIASIAHRHAVRAADARLQLAREIVLRDLTNE